MPVLRFPLEPVFFVGRCWAHVAIAVRDSVPSGSYWDDWDYLPEPGPAAAFHRVNHWLLHHLLVWPAWRLRTLDFWMSDGGRRAIEMRKAMKAEEGDYL